MCMCMSVCMYVCMSVCMCVCVCVCVCVWLTVMGSRWCGETRAQSQEVLRERLHILLQWLELLAGELRLCGVNMELLQVVAGLDGVGRVRMCGLWRDWPRVWGVRPC